MSNVAKIFDIREYNADTDKAFIMASTLKGAFYGCPRFKGFDKSLFMDSYKKILTRLVEDPDTIIMVAVSNEDSNLIFGYSILSSDFQTMHWVFVKSIYRRVGIGKSLVPAFATTYSHSTPIAEQLLTKFESKPVFNPFILGLL